MTAKRHLRVAAAQIESRFGDLDANLKKHLDIIARARREGVELLLFPELSLVGHGAGTETLRLARARDSEIVARLAEASGPMCSVFGLIEEGPAVQFYNAAFVVRDGALVFEHRKVNLATYGRLEEGKHYAQGRYVDTLGLDGSWRAGLMICADLWNPGLVHLTALHGATLLLAPISSAIEAVGPEFDNLSGWELNLRFYAVTYGLPIVMANRVGTEGGLTFWGGARILDPFGRTLAHAVDTTEQLVVAELDYEQVRKARYLLPTVRDSNLSLILRETERLSRIVGVPELVRKE